MLTSHCLLIKKLISANDGIDRRDHRVEARHLSPSVFASAVKHDRVVHIEYESFGEPSTELELKQVQSSFLNDDGIECGQGTVEPESCKRILGKERHLTAETPLFESRDHLFDAKSVTRTSGFRREEK